MLAIDRSQMKTTVLISLVLKRQCIELIRKPLSYMRKER